MKKLLYLVIPVAIGIAASASCNRGRPLLLKKIR
jgi:hypothetical protein